MDDKLKQMPLKKRCYPILDVLKSKSLGSFYIIIARIKPNKKIQVISFLIDAWKMGLKDCIVQTSMSRTEYKGLISYYKNEVELERISLEEAHWHIQQGLRIARSIGTPIPKTFFKYEYLIGDYTQIQSSGSLYKCYSCGKGELSEDEVEIIKLIAKKDMIEGVCGTNEETIIYFVCTTCKEKEKWDDEEEKNINEEFINKEKEIEKFLNNLLEHFKKSKEYQNLLESEQEKVEFTVQFFGKMMYLYHGEEPQEWTNNEIKLCCKDTLIRKVTAEPQYYESICPILTNFFRFIKREHHLPNAADLPVNLCEIHDIILDRFDSHDYCGPAKHFLMTAMEHGIDYEDNKAMNRFVQMYNSLYAPRPNNSKNTPYQKIGRNEPCHCGSGLKYKKCHWAIDKGLKRHELET